jgi:hypothetical protein
VRTQIDSPIQHQGQSMALCLAAGSRPDLQR